MPSGHSVTLTGLGSGCRAWSVRRRSCRRRSCRRWTAAGCRPTAGVAAAVGAIVGRRARRRRPRAERGAGRRLPPEGRSPRSGPFLSSSAAFGTVPSPLAGGSGACATGAGGFCLTACGSPVFRRGGRGEARARHQEQRHADDAARGQQPAALARPTPAPVDRAALEAGELVVGQLAATAAAEALDRRVRLGRVALSRKRFMPALDRSRSWRCRRARSPDRQPAQYLLARAADPAACAALGDQAPRDQVGRARRLRAAPGPAPRSSASAPFSSWTQVVDQLLVPAAPCLHLGDERAQLGDARAAHRAGAAQALPDGAAAAAVGARAARRRDRRRRAERAARRSARPLADVGDVELDLGQGQFETRGSAVVAPVVGHPRGLHRNWQARPR